MSNLIDKKELLKKKTYLWDEAMGTVACVLVEDIAAAKPVDAVEVGNCKGCIWVNRKRPQKCSCCRRNPDMKDCFEVDE